MQIFDSLIVGAGIAGLSAAWDLAQIQGETNILVLEQNSHVGGKIITRISETAGGRVIVDGGPESFVSRTPVVWDRAHARGRGARRPRGRRHPRRRRRRRRPQGRGRQRAQVRAHLFRGRPGKEVRRA